MRFCEFSRDAERCHQCLRCDWDVAGDFQQTRRKQASALLQACEAVIFPSVYLRRTYLDLLPDLAARRLEVVEPPAIGRNPPEVSGAARDEIRHLAYVGSVKPHKGALLFEELVRRFPASQFPSLRWTVYGGGDKEILKRLRALPKVRVRGYYRADDLPLLLHRDRVDLALLLSTWPESYALTFDECRQADVQVLAFDHGAMGERLRDVGGGVLVAPELGVDGVVEALGKQLGKDLPKPPSAAKSPLRLPDGVSAAEAMQAIYQDSIGEGQ